MVQQKYSENKLAPTNTFIQFSFLPYVEDSRPAVQLPRARIPFLPFRLQFLFIYFFNQTKLKFIYS